MRPIRHRIHLNQHFGFQVLIGSQMGGATTAADCLNVSVQLAQPTA